MVNRHYGNSARIVELEGELTGYKVKLPTKMVNYWRAANGVIDPEVPKLIRETVQRDWTVVDVGAHLGFTALLLADCVGENGSVVSFEPVPNNFQTLNFNVELNNCHNITTVQAAASDCTGHTEMQIDTKIFSMVSSLVQSRSIALPNPQQVETHALDDYFESNGLQDPDFVKIDVEGGEGLVLSGMTRILNRSQPKILVEIHNSPVFVGTTSIKAFGVLKSAGYSVYRIGKSGELDEMDMGKPLPEERFQCLAVYGGKA